jgi:hypothetical protein
MSTNQFLVIVNDTETFIKIPATKRAAQQFIKRYLVSTHMGQWIKTERGWNYNTTIGKYYQFVRV